MLCKQCLTELRTMSKKTFTKENAKAYGSKGGKASVKVKKEKKAMFEELCKYLLEGGSEKTKEALEQLEGKEFLDQFTKLLEYVKPKLARTDNTNTNSISVNWVEDLSAEDEAN